jgi:hypothetical protein
MNRLCPPEFMSLLSVVPWCTSLLHSAEMTLSVHTFRIIPPGNVQRKPSYAPDGALPDSTVITNLYAGALTNSSAMLGW